MFKYVSIDIESCGLDSKTCDMIEFGAVLDNLEDCKPINLLPRFHAYILPPNGKTYAGEPFALSMHADIFKRIAVREQPYQYLAIDKFMHNFRSFLNGYGYGKEINCTGKNFAFFDNDFIKTHVPDMAGVKFFHRILDIGSLYFNPKTDSVLPGLKDCLNRANLVNENVTHTAVEDALLVVKLIRKYYHLPME